LIIEVVNNRFNFLGLTEKPVLEEITDEFGNLKYT
jgi:hypothetical protein